MLFDQLCPALKPFGLLGPLALQVDFVKLLHDKLMAKSLQHADTPEEWRFPRPSFKVRRWAAGLLPSWRLSPEEQPGRGDPLPRHAACLLWRSSTPDGALLCQNWVAIPPPIHRTHSLTTTITSNPTSSPAALCTGCYPVC